jgi:hypothetical protein
MNIAIATLILEALLRYGPEFARQLVTLFSKTTPPNAAEWEVLFKLAEKSYDDYTRP